ncbi:MAG: VC0807 family protein [Bacillota bacterium]|nr:VC0807 family protein [Bacillota bacterium]
MYQGKEMNKQLSKIRKKLAINLIINWLVPLVLVMALHSYFKNDAVILAIAGAIPAIRTLVLLIWRRKVDWIGVLGTLGFGAAFTISMLSGGSALPMKLYHPIVTGILGLIFLGSAAVRKPLLIIIMTLLKHKSAEELGKPEVYKKLNMLSILLGFILFIEASIHIVMAFTLSTVTYLYMSRIVTWGSILVLFLGVRVFIPRINKA